MKKSFRSKKSGPMSKMEILPRKARASADTTSKKASSADEDEIVLEHDNTPSPANLPQVAAAAATEIVDHVPEGLPEAILTDHELEIINKRSTHNDPLAMYIREINKYPLLNLEEEKKLTREFKQTGDIEIAKLLVQSNLRLVVKIAMEYQRAFQNVLDLIQEGNIGLMRAVSKYDPDKGAKLSYYASWWIRSYILKFILDNFRLVKIGTTSEQKKLFYNLIREKEKLMGMGIRPETKLLSHNLGVSEKSVRIMQERLGPGSSDVSIDRPLYEDSNATLADQLSDEGVGIDEVLADAQGVEILKSHLHDFMKGLKDRDREIFEKRLLSEVPPSLQSIADDYGVSRERIRQVEERLLNKLRVYMSEFIR